ncbi:hypothetical protein TcG_05319 [Trypanosoma cruzi]|nr:hypothetical protein TcG_05319 [Trypanosoma cruzi]
MDAAVRVEPRTELTRQTSLGMTNLKGQSGPYPTPLAPESQTKIRSGSTTGCSGASASCANAAGRALLGARDLGKMPGITLPQTPARASPPKSGHGPFFPSQSWSG